MNIEIICVGTLKESWWKDAEAEYQKRLTRFCKIHVTQIRESKLPAKAGPAEEAAVIAAEGQAIMDTIGKGKRTYVVALDIKGEALSSEELAGKIASIATGGTSNLTFLIGGSLGLSRAVLAAADLRLSFSPMTFPHQVMRVLLQEQLYRAFKINSGETYHK